MKTILSKIIATGGVLAVCAAAGPGAFAQNFDSPYHNQHRRYHVQSLRQQISMMQAAYAHDVSMGDYAAAARDHRRAEMLRRRLRNGGDSFGSGYYIHHDRMDDGY